MIGETILHYQILEVIGSGAFGIVYKAQDEKLDTTRALKFVRSEITSDTDTQKSIRKEASTQAQLFHPHIAAVFALEEAEAGQFIVQEYIDGPDLDRFLQEYDHPFEDRLRILLETGSALSFAHSMGIIHRDIKPQNILVSSSGQAKVTDFGIARALDQTSQTLTLGPKGTAAYMAPEMFRGEQVGFQSDVWAFGILVYEILEGMRPFSGETFEVLAMSILSEDPQPVTDKIERQLPGLNEWMSRCLARDPLERFADCSESVQALADVISAAGFLEALPDNVPLRRKRQPLVRSGVFRSAVALTGVAVAALLLLTGTPSQPPHLDSLAWHPMPSSREIRSVSFSSTGDQFIYTDEAEDALHLITISDPIPVPTTITLPMADQLTSARWAPDSELLAVSGRNDFYLHDLETGTTRVLLPGRIVDYSWSVKGDSLAYIHFLQFGLFFHTCSPATGLSDPGSADISPRRVEVPSIAADPTDLQVYHPQFILDDTHFVFVVTRKARNLGVWSMPISGGDPVKLIDESYYPWNLVWDESTGSLLFTQYASEELYSVRVDKQGEAAGAIEAIGRASSLADFDYSTATEQYVAVSRTSEARIVALDLSGDDQFTTIVQGHTDIRSLAASWDGTVLYFAEIFADRGMQIYARSIGDTVTSNPLPEDIRYRERRDPAPYPLSDRYMVFRGYDGRHEGLYYYDSDRMQYEPLVADPSSDLRYLYLNWNPTGEALYSILFPSDPTSDRSLVRLNIHSDEQGLRVTSIDTLVTLPDLQRTHPGPENRYVFYTRGADRAAGDIYLLDSLTGNTSYVTEGASPALGNAGKDLYFYRNGAIWILRNWAEVIGTTVTAERLIDAPTRGLTLAQDRALIVAGDTLFLAYSQDTGTEIIWSYEER
ncbi:protein kinase [Gemmatimonadota bacterium]